MADTETLILEMLAEVKETIKDHRRESARQVGRVQQSVDALAERVNHQNGRVAKLETSRDEATASRRALKENTKARMDRFRFWVLVATGILAAILGSVVYVLLAHVVNT